MQKRKKSARAKKKEPRRTSRFTSDHVPIGAFKLKDAATYLNISKPTMTRLVQRGLVRANRTLRHYLFSREELDRFLREGQV
jgi:excisionase family DNA binding protein